MRILLALSLFVLPLWAEETPDLKKARAYVTKKDRDGDGRLTAEEAGIPEARFKQIDGDGDGFVEAEEIVARMKKRKGGAGAQRPPGRRDGAQDRARNLKRLFGRLDKNGDGKIAGDELPQGGRLDLSEADKNGDGAIDLFELTAHVEAMRDGRDGKPGAHDARGGGNDRAKRFAERLKRFDTNGDGIIERSEWKGDEQIFARLDRDGDGKIKLTDLKGRGGSGRDQAARFAKRLKRMDKNGDGVLDREEWKGPARIFERLDADRDGKITADEMAKAQRAFRGRGRFADRTGEAVFRRFDKNGDGKIAPDEWKLRQELFAKLDGNGDGFITRDEVTPRGPRGKGRRSRYDVNSGKDSEAFLAKHDKNGDGQIAKDEFKHTRRFAEMDADGDGVLSKQEVEDAMERGRRERAFDVFERFDLNRDGQITRDEFTGPAAAFEKLDKNADGIIDKLDK